MRAIFYAALLAAGAISNADAACDGHPSPCVKDFPIDYPDKAQFESQGSTHEITFNRNGGSTLWITAPVYAYVAEIFPNGAQKYFPLPAGSGPHGVTFDKDGRLFVSLEMHHQVLRMNAAGKVEAEIGVDADPHGLAVGPDGKTLWFTGKTKNVVGKILPDGKTTKTFALATPNALPIYIAAGPDGNMWFTELMGNKIGRVTADGKIGEFPILTPGSRPIAIGPDPSGQSLMWFSEEVGNKVARIDMQGGITEFPVPKSQENVILAGLAFDGAGNLWVQQYVDQNEPSPPGADHVIKIDKSILKASRGDKLTFTFYEVPTHKTVMHRIIQGPDKNMWFTELKSDRVGRVDDK